MKSATIKGWATGSSFRAAKWARYLVRLAAGSGSVDCCGTTIEKLHELLWPITALARKLTGMLCVVLLVQSERLGTKQTDQCSRS